jgi:hypothetical protein
MASPGKKAYPLRIDPALWAEIERMAAQELRSANAQVEYLLREALARRGRAQAEPDAAVAQDASRYDNESNEPNESVYNQPK